jgi:hypothetical protein
MKNTHDAERNRAEDVFERESGWTTSDETADDVETEDDDEFDDDDDEGGGEEADA